MMTSLVIKFTDGNGIKTKRINFNSNKELNANADNFISALAHRKVTVLGYESTIRVISATRTFESGKSFTRIF